MPLPDPRPPLVSAPRRAGVGLRAELLRQRARRPPDDWPCDWWQRNYDLLWEEQGPEEPLLYGRQLRIPPPPPGGGCP